jgi:hypothetical protein
VAILWYEVINCRVIRSWNLQRETRDRRSGDSSRRLGCLDISTADDGTSISFPSTTWIPCRRQIQLKGHKIHQLIPEVVIFRQDNLNGVSDDKIFSFLFCGYEREKTNSREALEIFRQNQQFVHRSRKVGIQNSFFFRVLQKHSSGENLRHKIQSQQIKLLYVHGSKRDTKLIYQEIRERKVRRILHYRTAPCIPLDRFDSKPNTFCSDPT